MNLRDFEKLIHFTHTMSIFLTIHPKVEGIRIYTQILKPYIKLYVYQ